MDAIGLISICISAIVMVVSVLTFNAAVKERHTKSAAVSAEIASSLKFLQDLVEELDKKIDRLQEQYHDNDKRIEALETKVETRLTGIDARIKRVEGRIDRLEAK